MTYVWIKKRKWSLVIQEYKYASNDGMSNICHRENNNGISVKVTDLNQEERVLLVASYEVVQLCEISTNNMTYVSIKFTEI